MREPSKASCLKYTELAQAQLYVLYDLLPTHVVPKTGIQLGLKTGSSEPHSDALTTEALEQMYVLAGMDP